MDFDPEMMHQLEEEIEHAIAQILEDEDSVWPIGPDSATVHFMAKAAVAAYEAAVAQYEEEVEPEAEDALE